MCERGRNRNIEGRGRKLRKLRDVESPSEIEREKKKDRERHALRQRRGINMWKMRI